MENETGQDKRKYQRVNVPELKVNFKLLDPRTWSTYQERSLNPVENISMGGVAVHTENQMELKSPVRIDIKVPEQDIIRTFGRVVWIQKEPDNNYRMGISFSWWKKEEDKKTVQDVIQKNA